MDVRMDGRNALITGGSRGLGRAMALKFAAAGAKVAIAARRAEVLDETRAEIAGQTKAAVAAFPCDVSRADQIEDLFEAVIGEFGTLDILVNNAGRSQAGPFEEITDAVWQADLDLKLFAAIRLTRLAFPGMKARRWGRVLNVLNTGAKAPRPGGAPTVVSRAAGMALTKVLAGEGAPYNVLVNALCTGSLVTDQVVRRHRDLATDVSLEDYITEEGRAIPLGRMGDAEEYASLACFLASDAGSYVTGTAINVDGGRCPVV
jgi:NAD(P)-dependent dehydrogenase (short-subunit alcohol dehydrogenase family)